MQILFVSECSSYFNILKSSLSNQFPELQFVHYSTLEAYDPNQNAIRFSHLILKLTEPEKQLKSLTSLKKQIPGIKSIALSTQKFQMSEIQWKKVVDFHFQDQDIEIKLQSYFHHIFSDTKNPEDWPLVKLGDHCRKYVHLKAHLSECLYMIFLGLTAADIANRLCKSERSIEEYTLQLKKIFEVSTKKELQEIYLAISQMDEFEAQKMA